jgi:xyloglucan O-acetyltransferase
VPSFHFPSSCSWFPHSLCLRHGFFFLSATPQPHLAAMVTNFLQKYQFQNHQLVLSKKQLVTYALYALLALALLHYLLFSLAPVPEKSVMVPRVQETVEAVVSARVNASEQLSPPPPSPVGQQGDELLVSPQGK